MERFLDIVLVILRAISIFIASVLALVMGFLAFLNFRELLSGDAVVLEMPGSLWFSAIFHALFSSLSIAGLILSFKGILHSGWTCVVIIAVAVFSLSVNVLFYIGPELVTAFVAALIVFASSLFISVLSALLHG